MTGSTQEQRWDHERDLRKHEPNPRLDLTVTQRFALARLVGLAEGVVSSGALGDGELAARVVIADALAAFGMPSKLERSDA